MDQLRVKIFDKSQLAYTGDFSGVVTLGRQDREEPGPFHRKWDAKDDCWRLVIAGLEEITISRRHLSIEPEEGRVRVRNRSRQSLRMPDGQKLEPDEGRLMDLPALFAVGARAVRLERPGSEALEIQALAEPTLLPGATIMPVARPSLDLAQFSDRETELLVRWLQTATGVMQAAATSTEFFPRAAQAMVDLVGLDSGRVLMLEKGEWRIRALRPTVGTATESSWSPSRQVLKSVVEGRRTYWKVPSRPLSEEGSLLGLEAVVAAPILDRNGETIGILYGERRRGGSAGGGPSISRHEAMLVELLASGVATGLARVEQEQAALALRVQFDQFFSPELSRKLVTDPDLLQGRDAEVTVLFCDIRGFSRISAAIGPTATVEWINDVMSALSECVTKHEGVLVDYIGDELIAMWGAPERQPDHAPRACRAAIDMLRAVPALNARWSGALKQEMDVGIGLNSGLARVGNIGSRRKFKYGPLGSAVNVASRVQGATKYLKCRLLMTGETRQRLDPSFTARRLCVVRVVNIPDAVTLHELRIDDSPDLVPLHREYERALEEFERQDFGDAARTLGNLLASYPDDAPSLLLLQRSVGQLVDPDGAFDPIWELPGK